MTDEQILRALDCDPAKMTKKLTQGVDGYSTRYTGGMNEVVITRSVVTGVYIWRIRPKSEDWDLGKP
jgi:hypothetical protein